LLEIRGIVFREVPMRKYVFVLPACAILFAAAVLLTQLGSSLAAQGPDVVPESSATASNRADNDDISAADWTETAKIVDTRKSRLPHPRTKH
jgi:hypothetical protein